MLNGLTPIGVTLPYIKTKECSLSIYSNGAIEDLETFDHSRLRRNFASVICEGQCKAFVVGHSLRPTALVQCEGDKAVSCGRKDATRASFPPCWVYYAHQCRRSRHRRVHSCCRSACDEDSNGVATTNGNAYHLHVFVLSCYRSISYES